MGRRIANPRVLLPLLAAFVAGCAAEGFEPIVVPPPDGTMDFTDLAVVLAAVVDDDGRVEPTALAAHLPRLNRQLGRLSGPWPAVVRSGADSDRLAWLYNTRMAWSLRIVAADLRPAGRRGDRFALPATIDVRRLLETPFTLDRRTCTLGEIDRQLAAYDDYRVPAAAPGATDLAGPMARAPFTAKTVTASLAERFDRTVRDADRLVIDHDAKRLLVPPVLWRLAPAIQAEYNRRFGAAGASLATALGAAVGPRARDRLTEAQGYEVAVRTRPVGIVAAPPE